MAAISVGYLSTTSVTAAAAAVATISADAELLFNRIPWWSQLIQTIPIHFHPYCGSKHTSSLINLELNVHHHDSRKKKKRDLVLFAYKTIK